MQYDGRWHMCKSGCGEKVSDNYLAVQVTTYAELIEHGSYARKHQREEAVREADKLGWKAIAYASCEFIGKDTFEIIGEKLGWSGNVSDTKLFDDDQSVWLFQEKSSNKCTLSFPGTVSFWDLLDDVLPPPVGFCGFLDEDDNTTFLQDGHAFVHRGFRQQLMYAVKSRAFQEHIRPKLQHCDGLDVMGHSLGGAMASLFAACVNRAPQEGQAGFMHYAYMGFKKGEPKAYPAITV